MYFPNSALRSLYRLDTAWLCQTCLALNCERGLGPEPDSLHIHQAQGLAAINLLRDIREGLVTFDEQGELVPGRRILAGPGRRQTIPVYFAPDARWSNGDPVTAEDFVQGMAAGIYP